MGVLLLQGGAEFGGRMRDSDLQAIALAGGFNTPIIILPTAAAPDANHARAGSNAIQWFTALGAKSVRSLPIINSASANNPSLIKNLESAKLIYLLGGFTHYLAQTLINSLAWQACLNAFNQGAVIAGSSAGAMVLCEYYFDPESGNIQKGLNLINNSLVLPHYNSFGKKWVKGIQQKMPTLTLIGIDEQTGMLMQPEPNQWLVLGGGQVTIHQHAQQNRFSDSQIFSLINEL